MTQIKPRGGGGVPSRMAGHIYSNLKTHLASMIIYNIFQGLKIIIIVQMKTFKCNINININTCVK